MFLVCCESNPHILYCILEFIENHSVLVGVITSVVVGSLWMRKFLKQKRAEAFFGFYTKLSLFLNELQTNLDEKNLLNISDSDAGNIYALIYVPDYLKIVCPKFSKIENNDLKPYQEIANRIKELLLNTENNVYPKGAKRDKWYKSQQAIFSFCEFITNDAYRQITNIKSEPEAQHITKCKLLVDAIDYIQQSIYNSKY